MIVATNGQNESNIHVDATPITKPLPNNHLFLAVIYIYIYIYSANVNNAYVRFDYFLVTRAVVEYAGRSITPKGMVRSIWYIEGHALHFSTYHKKAQPEG